MRKVINQGLKFCGSLIFLSALFISHNSEAQGKYNEPKAWLRVLVDKDSVALGDSFLLTLIYEVSNQNKPSIQFYKPNEQLNTIVRTLTDLGLHFNEGIDEIKGIKVEDGIDGSSVQYHLYKAHIIPSKAGLLEIPSLTLKMKLFASGQSLPSDSLAYKESRLIDAVSRPRTVQVFKLKSIPEKKFPIVKGPLLISENLSQKTISTGDTLHYEISISGPNVGLTLEVEEKLVKSLQIHRDYISYHDSLTTVNEVGFTKTYYLSLVATKAGTFRLQDILQFPYLNALGDKVYIKPSAIIKAKGSRRKGSFPSKPTPVFALDISESMKIEDYKPSRLFKGFELLEAYNVSFGEGKTLGFSGAVINLKEAPLNDSITSYSPKRGTAIGNAIWLGTQLINLDTETKALIIVGDGDNTAGNVSVTAAAEYAKQHGVKIYTIGLGHTGRVSFGKDLSGRPKYVDNTFSETSLRLASEITGGNYYYFDDYESPEALMQIIYQEIHK